MCKLNSHIKLPLFLQGFTPSTNSLTDGISSFLQLHPLASQKGNHRCLQNHLHEPGGIRSGSLALSGDGMSCGPFL